LKEIPVKRDEDRVNLIETLKDDLLSVWELRRARYIRSLRSMFKSALRKEARPYIIETESGDMREV